jgi:carbon-monoxide dehydrogenase large subunit
VLYEDLVYDGNGQLLTTSFMDYILPTAKELPAVEVAHIETLPPVTVSGFKGMGEGGTLGATAAAANAVADALAPLGIRVAELPLSPDRIYRLIRSRQQSG